MRAVVVALGKIGLPLAVQLARTGHDVLGCDIDQRVVDDVNAARQPFPGETGLAEALEEVVGAGRLRAVTSTVASSIPSSTASNSLRLSIASVSLIRASCPVQSA